jgi:hypothetical protein
MAEALGACSAGAAPRARSPAPQATTAHAPAPAPSLTRAPPLAAALMPAVMADDDFLPPYRCRMLCWCARDARGSDLACRLSGCCAACAPLTPLPRSDPSAPPGGHRRGAYLRPAGAPGLPPVLDFTSGDDAACGAAGLRPMRGASAPVVRYRGVGNNAVKAAFKAAGFRRESPEMAAVAASRGGLFAPGPPKRGRRPAPRAPPPVGDDGDAAESAPPAGELGPPPFTALWGGQLSTDEYAALAPGITVNHFPCANELGRKDRLAGALRAAAVRSGAAAFPFHPRTFCLPGDGAAWAAEAAAAAAAHAGAVAAALAAAAFEGGEAAAPPAPRLYVCKPPALSRGRGVRVSTADAVPRRRKLLVQRYVHPPHLLDGLKYDLRLYVCVTSVAPLRAYIHREGLARFAVAPYDPASLDAGAHVTNVSVTSKDAAGRFVANADASDDGVGTKWSLSALRRRLRADGEDWEALWGRICDVVARTLIAAAPRMAPAAASSGAPAGSCFELYGFDILLDASLTPWLLEVNTGPNLAAPTPMDMHIKCRIAAEMLHLVGITPPIVHAGVAAARRRRAAAAGEEVSEDTPSEATEAQPTTPDGGGVEAAWAGGHLPLAQQPLCVRRMVAESTRRGGFDRVFPSPDPARNAAMLPLLSPQCEGAAAMCAYLAARAAKAQATTAADPSRRS